MKIKRLNKDISLDEALNESSSSNEKLGSTDYQRIVNAIIRPYGDYWRIELSGGMYQKYSFEIRQAFPLPSTEKQVLDYISVYSFFNTFEEAQEYMEKGFERLRNAIDKTVIAELEAKVQRKRIEELSKGFTFLYRTPQTTDSEIVEIKL